MSHAVRKWVQLEQPRLGSRVTFATDEFFGAKERLIDTAEPVFVADKYDDLGPAAGILSAMETHPDVDWLVIACDLPNLDAETLEFLIANSPAEKPFSAYRSSYDDLPEPLCAIYRRGSGQIVRGFIDDGIKCPRKMLIRSDTALLAQPDPASLDNVNTPEDLAASKLSQTA